MIAIVMLAMLSTLATVAVSPAIGWQVAFIAKPLVDIGWSAEYLVLGLTPLEIIGAGVPALVLARMAIGGGLQHAKLPLKGPWVAYVLTVLMGSLLFATSGDYIGSVSFLFRTLNGVVAFYSMAVCFSDCQRFRSLVIALLIAGIVPMAMGFYESVTGHHWRLRYGAGEQIRITGLYHNSTNLRYYAYATLTGIALFWVYFAPRRLLRALLLIYAAVCSVVLFKVYSKAGFITIGFAAVAWAVIGRKLLWPALLVLAALVANYTLQDVVVREVSATFEKDIGAIQGTESSSRAFGGRMGMWREQWGSFWAQDTLSQVFGSGETGGGRGVRAGGHNDYLRVLFQTGAVGLAAYLWLLLATGLALIRDVTRQRTPLLMIALVVYVGWIVESIGLTPGIYPGFQWYSWGLIALALTKVRDLDDAGFPVGALSERRPRFPNFVDALQPRSQASRAEST